jgi:opacity protein-like surface antigen
MKKKIILNSLLLLGCSLTYAGELGNLAPPHRLRPFAVLTGGVDFIQTRHSQNVALLHPFINHYTSHSSFQTSGSVGLGGGAECQLSECFFLQLGVAGFYNSPVSSHGEVWQLGLPEFANFRYRYRIRPYRVVATGKLLGTIKQMVHPYVSAELGAAFNAARSYHEVPLIEEAVKIPPFGSHTENSFAWAVGAGVDVDLCSCLQLGVGYQFADLGNVSLGLSHAQETRSRLRISNLYDHQIRLQLTALM